MKLVSDVVEVLKINYIFKYRGLRVGKKYVNGDD